MVSYDPGRERWQLQDWRKHHFWAAGVSDIIINGYILDKKQIAVKMNGANIIGLRFFFNVMCVFVMCVHSYRCLFVCVLIERSPIICLPLDWVRNSAMISSRSRQLLEIWMKVRDTHAQIHIHFLYFSLFSSGRIPPSFCWNDHGKTITWAAWHLTRLKWLNLIFFALMCHRSDLLRAVWTQKSDFFSNQIWVTLIKSNTCPIVYLCHLSRHAI